MLEQKLKSTVISPQRDEQDKRSSNMQAKNGNSN